MEDRKGKIMAEFREPGMQSRVPIEVEHLISLRSQDFFQVILDVFPGGL